VREWSCLATAGGTPLGVLIEGSVVEGWTDTPSPQLPIASEGCEGERRRVWGRRRRWFSVQGWCDMMLERIGPIA
jgi:hypothetical protein